MAKLSEISLDDLYARKITSSVEAEILRREDFSTQAPNWCKNVCKLKCKNPPLGNNIYPKNEVDILIIQDYKAFDDPKFNRKGQQIEAKHMSIIEHFANLTLRNDEGKKLRYATTSMLKCQLDKTDLKKGKAPTDAVLQKCKPYLLEEIRLRKPKLIISLSTSVTKVLGLKKKSNYNERGEIVVGDAGIPIVITAHPRILLMLRQNSSGKMWGPDFYSVVLRDFQKAADIINGKLEVPNLEAALEKVKPFIHIARSLEDVKRFTDLIIAEGAKRKVFSFDTETSSLDPYLPTAKLLCAQFGYRDDNKNVHAFVIPLWHRENKWYDADKAWPMIVPILLSEEIMKIGHNIKFDIIYTAVTTGVRPRGIFFDTMLVLHAINSGLQGMYGLKKAVHDWIPESGLGSYEDKLPKLTKVKKVNTDGSIEDEDDENEDFEGED
jgi:hypothetical protein